METMERERIEDIKGMTAAELVEYLRTVEECEIRCNPYHSNPKGFDLYFVPQLFCLSKIEHITDISIWAQSHRHTILLLYDTYQKALEVKINRLYSEETYPPEDILK